MCPCPNSPWVRNARAYRKRNRTNANAVWYTIDYLLRHNNCGIGSTTSIENIVEYLNTKGYSFTRESFQQKILNHLKRNGLVASLVNPGRRGGGLFIPCNEDEIRHAALQMLNRVHSEVLNFEGITGQTRIGDSIANLRRTIRTTRDSL